MALFGECLAAWVQISTLFRGECWVKFLPPISYCISSRGHLNDGVGPRIIYKAKWAYIELTASSLSVSRRAGMFNSKLGFGLSR